jgi:hypothetical protein
MSVAASAEYRSLAVTRFGQPRGHQGAIVFVAPLPQNAGSAAFAIGADRGRSASLAPLAWHDEPMGWAVNVHANGECYVIRVRPWNYEWWPLGLGWPWRGLEGLQRLMEGDHRWTLRVRRFAEDPRGPVVHEESIASRSKVPAAIQRTQDLLRSGELTSRDQAS